MLVKMYGIQHMFATMLSMHSNNNQIIIIPFMQQEMSVKSSYG